MEERRPCAVQNGTILQRVAKSDIHQLSLVSHHQGLFIAAEQEGPLTDRCLMISWEEPRRVAAFRGRASPRRRLSLLYPELGCSPHTPTSTSAATTTTSYLKKLTVASRQSISEWTGWDCLCPTDSKKQVSEKLSPCWTKTHFRRPKGE